MSWTWLHRARLKAYSAGENRLEVLEAQGHSNIQLRKGWTSRKQPTPVMTRSIIITNGWQGWRISKHQTESEFPGDKDTVLSPLCDRMFGKFGILTLITLPIFRKAEGEKLSFALKEWHTLYYDCVDTNNTAVHSVPVKALLLSSWHPHLGFLGNNLMKQSFSPLQKLRHKQLQTACPGLKGN